MDPTLIASVVQLGPTGVMFYVWYNDQNRINSMLAVIQEQIDDKKLMREERSQLIDLIKEQSRLLERVSGALSDCGKLSA